MRIPSNTTLVDLVIEHLQQQPEKLKGEPKGLASDKLANLTFPDGKALPPSLKKWLAFDARQVGIFEDLDNPIASSCSLSDVNGKAFATMDRLLFPAKMYALFPNDYDCNSYFLYTGEADDQQEYPIIFTDIDDRYLATLYAPNFAIYLATKYKVWDFNLYNYQTNPSGYTSLLEHPELREIMEWHAYHNFSGYKYLEIYGEAITIDGRETKWCSEADIVFDLRKQGFEVNSLEEFFRGA